MNPLGDCSWVLLPAAVVLPWCFLLSFLGVSSAPDRVLDSQALLDLVGVAKEAASSSCLAVLLACGIDALHVL